MSIGRGLFRLWLVVMAVWAGLMWALFNDLPSHPLFPAVVRWTTAEEAFDHLGPNQSERIVVRPSSGPMVAPWMVAAAVPPAIVFVVGTGLFWAVRGFRP
jgi:hypothetical protein